MYNQQIASLINFGPFIIIYADTISSVILK